MSENPYGDATKIEQKRKTSQTGTPERRFEGDIALKGELNRRSTVSQIEGVRNSLGGDQA
jgi:polygalacturonase